MTEPAISVIVRTLGPSGHLADALESLARQPRRDFEAVVVDMSPGGIEEVLARVALRLPRLRHLTPGRRLSRYDPEHLDRRKHRRR
jgi:GT2 family glycosyltransferase